MRRLLLLFLLVASSPAVAIAEDARCGIPFDRWLAELRREALSRGIEGRTLDAAAPLMKIDRAVLARDRGQHVFTQTFVEFATRMVEGPRLAQGRRRLASNAATFARIERDYGVPAPVIAAFWGLETDYGANMGDIPTFRALATLAHDCRRAALFREQLFAALRILQNGDLPLSRMRGPFAGELGQLQFLPTHYLDYAVDDDGDGRRDLLASTPDALASAAHYAARLGWRRGEPWLEEVRVPPDFAWEHCGLDIELPRSQWKSRGVTRIDGRPLPADALPASLLLPVGRQGPAFLAYPNFRLVYLQWNKSLVYSTTAAYMATRLAGAPRMTVHAKIPSLGLESTKTLQRELTRRGFEIGKIDGVLGLQTRSAVREMQRRLGLPADSWPTPQLLEKLTAGGHR